MIVGGKLAFSFHFLLWKIRMERQLLSKILFNQNRLILILFCELIANTS